MAFAVSENGGKTIRPIDAERLKNKLLEYCREHYDDDSLKSFTVNVLMMRVIEIVKKEPTLSLDDLRPKGQWITRGGRKYCSHCNTKACVTRDRDDYWYTEGTKFCPSCGADMRGGDMDE